MHFTNRNQQLEFIEKNHPVLLEYLMEHIPNFPENLDNLTSKEIKFYNNTVIFYCGSQSYVWDLLIS